MRLRNGLCLWAFVLSCVAVSAPLLAQTETGRITGLVTDPSGLIVPGATVTLTSPTTGAVRTTTSDSAGRYVVASVQPGAYSLRIELAGFAPVMRDVLVTVGSSVAIDTQLRVAGGAETVSVTAEVPFVNVSNAEIATTVRQEQIRDLPLLSRNPYDLVALAGNVQDQPRDQVDNDSMRGPGFSVNGQRASSSNVMLDGSANNNEFDTTVGQDVPLDAVQEFSVVTNNFSAQYGRATGGIINVITKSGTNTLSGTAYTFFRNSSLASNTPDNVANNLPKGDIKRNQPGYSIGGPIVRDKVHFFSSLEYVGVRRTDSEISWVPTAEFLAASSPATRAYFAAYDRGVQPNGPTLTRADVSALIGSGAGAFNSLPAGMPIFRRVDRLTPTEAPPGDPDDPQDDYRLVNKVDFNTGPNTMFSIRHAYQNKGILPGAQSANPYPGYDTGVDYNRHNLLGSVTRVLSSNQTSQTKFVWNRLFEEQPVNGPSEPRLMMNWQQPILLQGYRITFPGYLPWDPAADIPFGGPQQLLQLYHDQTWLRGVHDIRFGGSYVHINDDRTFSAYGNAVEALSLSNSALNSLNNFVTGTIERFQAAINPDGFPGETFVTPVQQPSFTSHNRYDEFALYVQDNWSASPRLTLNLGVRYEFYGPQRKSDPKYDSNFYYADPSVSVSSSTPQQIVESVRLGQVFESNVSPVGGLWANDWNNFAPRIGAAWDVNGDGRTSVRAGYGIAYERNFGNVTYNVLFNPPLYLVSTIDAGPDLDVPSQPIFVENGGPFAGTPGVVKTIPVGSLRHVDQNIKTAYVHQYGVSYQSQFGNGWTGGIDYNGATGRELYDLADVNKRGARLIYEGVGTAGARPNPQYAAFNTRGNRGRSQYHGVTFALDSREIVETGVTLTSRYSLGWARDNLSDTFSRGNNGFYNTGYLDAFDPMLDWGYAEHDVRHRLSLSAVWNIPYQGTGGKEAALGGWQLNAIITARSGYPFSVFDCTNQATVCMRAVDSVGIETNVGSGVATGNPNEYELLDLTPILADAGSYINPITLNTDYGPYPANMTERDLFRGPGAWNVNMGLNKRFRFGTKAVQARFEVFNLFNHANMYVRGADTDIAVTTMVKGFKDDFRRMQLGVKYEF